MKDIIIRLTQRQKINKPRQQIYAEAFKNKMISNNQNTGIKRTAMYIY